MTAPLLPKPGGLIPPWSWCASCHRAYITGTYRLVSFTDTGRSPATRVLKLCPYLDCGGNSLEDRWRWSSLRVRHPEYPEYPQLYIRYADGVS